MHVKTIISVIAVFVMTISKTFPAHAQFIYSPEQARPLYSPDTLNICIMGDMMMHSAQISNADRYGFDTYFKHLKDHIESADIAVANLEYTHAGEPYTGYPAFSAPNSFSEYLAECGFDVFLCANNHIFDKGSKGAERTLAVFSELQDRYGIQYCGLAMNEDERERNNPLFITVKGIRTAIINFTYGTNVGADRHWPKVNYAGERKRVEESLNAAQT